MGNQIPQTTPLTTPQTAKQYDVTPTLRQKMAFDKMVENGGNKGLALRESGYSEAVANNPTKVTKTKGWKQLEQERLSDDLLSSVHEEGLKATKSGLEYRLVEEENEDGEVEEVLKRVPVDIPDQTVRQKFLDIAYKVRGMYPREGGLGLNDVFSLAEFAMKLEKREQMGLEPIQAEVKVVDVKPKTDNDTTPPASVSGREEKRREEK